MQAARLILDRDYQIGPIDPRLFGAFLEQLGRAIYTGIYEPGHPTADEHGFRQDVLALVRRMGVPIVRWPGGNFVSGYQWEDGIGPVSERPRRLDLAWFSTETNAVGVHEFCEWSKKAGAGVMMAINLGTRGVQAAQSLVEYCNHPGGTQWSDLRKKNGAPDPFGVKLWCLGNEMDGSWQIGQKTALEYARAAKEAGKVMKWVDPTIELVACGSSGMMMPTFGAWEDTVLGEVYDIADYLSLHQYINNTAGDTPNFLAQNMLMDAFIRSLASICDAVGARKRSKKKMYLSFDEWNVWYHSHGRDQKYYDSRVWHEAPPLLEDVYTFEDALAAGGMLLTLLKNADRVKIACLAQLVNVIAPIMTRKGGGAWCNTLYYPFMHASLYGRGISLRPIVDCPCYATKDFDQVPALDTAAVLGDDGALTVFALNRSPEDIALTLDTRAFGNLRLGEHILLQHDDLRAVNTEQAPDTVRPRAVSSRALPVKVPAYSWNVLRFGAGDE